jgi:hypothetical protein
MEDEPTWLMYLHDKQQMAKEFVFGCQDLASFVSFT